MFLGTKRNNDLLKSLISKVWFRVFFGMVVWYVVRVLCFDSLVPPLFRGNGGGFESDWLSIPAACSWSRFLFQVVS